MGSPFLAMISICNNAHFLNFYSTWAFWTIRLLFWDQTLLNFQKCTPVKQPQLYNFTAFWRYFLAKGKYDFSVPLIKLDFHWPWKHVLLPVPNPIGLTGHPVILKFMPLRFYWTPTVRCSTHRQQLNTGASHKPASQNRQLPFWKHLQLASLGSYTWYDAVMPDTYIFFQWDNKKPISSVH